MFNKLIIVIFLLVIAGFIGGIIYLSSHPKPQTLPFLQQQSSSLNTKNQQVEQEAQDFDNELNKVDRDFKTIDEGLNDQPENLQ